LGDAASKGVDISIAIPALSNALTDANKDVRRDAARALGNAAYNGADISVAIPALANALSDENEYVRTNAAWALGKVIQKSTSIEPLDEIETKLRESYDALRDKCRNQKQDELVEIGFTFSKLMNEIAKKKNSLAPMRDILLDDVPKPPKKGEIYQQVRGTVRNG
jgi:DNA anti-recombination protein RmuC